MDLQKDEDEYVEGVIGQLNRAAAAIWLRIPRKSDEERRKQQLRREEFECAKAQIIEQYEPNVGDLVERLFQLTALINQNHNYDLQSEMIIAAAMISKEEKDGK